jgi:hypothetical protein
MPLPSSACKLLRTAAILADMTSLALAAHAAAAPPFNTAFYATAATIIIPVLFLAIGVQGPCTATC